VLPGGVLRGQGDMSVHRDSQAWSLAVEYDRRQDLFASKVVLRPGACTPGAAPIPGPASRNPARCPRLGPPLDTSNGTMGGNGSPRSRIVIPGGRFPIHRKRDAASGYLVDWPATTAHGSVTSQRSPPAGGEGHPPTLSISGPGPPLWKTVRKCGSLEDAEAHSRRLWRPASQACGVMEAGGSRNKGIVGAAHGRREQHCRISPSTLSRPASPAEIFRPAAGVLQELAPHLPDKNVRDGRRSAAFMWDCVAGSGARGRSGARGGRFIVRHRS